MFSFSASTGTVCFLTKLPKGGAGNVCSNFNDVYLMMPELMSQQTIMVEASDFHISIIMMRGMNEISVDSSQTATAKPT
jgi:hypothetical protein